MTSPFTRKTLSFLRALTRNNDREWFKARKADYERHVREPMLAVLERLARDLRPFAPELMSDPKVSLYRIYRDTRFSADKSPLKTHAAAHFPARGFARGEGAGLYFEIAPQWVWIGGGLYMPGTTELRAIREHIVASHPRLHRIVTSKRFSSQVGPLDGERLTPAPRGYPKDHPAVHYLHFKQFLAGREYGAEFACSSAFYPELLRTFRASATLVQFLNEGLATRRVALATRRAPEDPVLNLATRGRRQQTGRAAPQRPEPMW